MSAFIALLQYKLIIMSGHTSCSESKFDISKSFIMVKGIITNGGSIEEFFIESKIIIDELKKKYLFYKYAKAYEQSINKYIKDCMICKYEYNGNELIFSESIKKSFEQIYNFYSLIENSRKIKNFI